VQIYIEPETDMRKAIALEQSRRAGRDLPANLLWGPQGTLYSEYVRYVEQLRRYHDRFPAEQILVLVYDDYRSDNEATVRKVQRFLEVDDTQPIKVKESNPTVRVRSQRLHSIVHAVAAGEGPVPRAMQTVARRIAPPQLSRQSALAIRNRLLFSRPRSPDEQLMLELRRRFKGEVESLSEYLGRDLVKLWGYDSLS
jgi:hypothetical protein